MKYAAVIHDKWNVIVRVEERPTEERAIKAGEFFAKRGYWYLIASERDIEMYKSMINA